MAELPKPTILPPLVVVVLTHASTAKASGPAIGVELLTRPFGVPSNVDAVLASPLIAPAAPRVNAACWRSRR